MLGLFTELEIIYACSLHCDGVCEKKRALSIKTRAKDTFTEFCITSIAHWNVAGAFLNPKHIRV